MISRLNSTIIGILFILGTLTGVITALIQGPILSAPDYLAEIARNQTTYNLAIFIQFLMAATCAGIGLAMYPIVKQHHAGLAIGSTGFRLLESAMQLMGMIGAMGLLVLSRQYDTAAVETSALYVAGNVILDINQWINSSAMLLCWCIGAAMIYWVFYRHHYVPRWLSGLGLAGIAYTTIVCTLVFLQIVPAFGIIQNISSGVMMIQELVFAIWLISKGIQWKQSQKPIAI